MKHFPTLTKALAVSLVALSTSPALADTPANALVIAQNIDDIVTIDPASAYEFTSGEYVANTYDQLVQYDADDTTVLAPGLAESWDIDAAAKTVTFELRDGVTFSSGNPMRGTDVLESWRRVLTLQMAPAFILENLGWSAENIDEMVTVDGNTVIVRWAGDFAPSFVLNVLAARPAAVVDIETAMANQVDGDMGHAWLNQNSAGTGPFTLARYAPGEVLMLEANANYWNTPPGIERVMIRHVAEAATQRLLLESGDVDMAKNLTPDQIAGLSGNADIKVETYPQTAVHWFSFNQKFESLTNPALWEASRYLVDYNGMADSF
ncbi:MAG: ABC transporter substrate-binding protein, partial [Pseudomonadota bacterium]